MNTFVLLVLAILFIFLTFFIALAALVTAKTKFDSDVNSNKLNIADNELNIDNNNRQLNDNQQVLTTQNVNMKQNEELGLMNKENIAINDVRINIEGENTSYIQKTQDMLFASSNALKVNSISGFGRNPALEHEFNHYIDQFKILRAYMVQTLSDDPNKDLYIEGFDMVSGSFITSPYGGDGGIARNPALALVFVQTVYDYYYFVLVLVKYYSEAPGYAEFIRRTEGITFISVFNAYSAFMLAFSKSPSLIHAMYNDKYRFQAVKLEYMTSLNKTLEIVLDPYTVLKDNDFPDKNRPRAIQQLGTQLPPFPTEPVPNPVNYFRYYS